MIKQYRFNFKLDADDKRMLALVAWQLQRSQADAVRWLIRQAAAAFTPPTDWEFDTPEDFGDCEEAPL